MPADSLSSRIGAPSSISCSMRKPLLPELSTTRSAARSVPAPFSSPLTPVTSITPSAAREVISRRAWKPARIETLSSPST